MIQNPVPIEFGKKDHIAYPTVQAHRTTKDGDIHAILSIEDAGASAMEKPITIETSVMNMDSVTIRRVIWRGRIPSPSSAELPHPLHRDISSEFMMPKMPLSPHRQHRHHEGPAQSYLSCFAERGIVPGEDFKSAGVNLILRAVITSSTLAKSSTITRISLDRIPISKQILCIGKVHHDKGIINSAMPGSASPTTRNFCAPIEPSMPAPAPKFAPQAYVQIGCQRKPITASPRRPSLDSCRI